MKDEYKGQKIHLQTKIPQRKKKKNKQEGRTTHNFRGTVLRGAFSILYTRHSSISECTQPLKIKVIVLHRLLDTATPIKQVTPVL